MHPHGRKRNKLSTSIRAGGGGQRRYSKPIDMALEINKRNKFTLHSHRMLWWWGGVYMWRPMRLIDAWSWRNNSKCKISQLHQVLNSPRVYRASGARWCAPPVHRTILTVWMTWLNPAALSMLTSAAEAFPLKIKPDVSSHATCTSGLHK